MELEQPLTALEVSPFITTDDFEVARPEGTTVLGKAFTDFADVIGTFLPIITEGGLVAAPANVDGVVADTDVRLEFEATAIELCVLPVVLRGGRGIDVDFDGPKPDVPTPLSTIVGLLNGSGRISSSSGSV